MRTRRFSAWFPVVWTLTMGVWLVVHHQTEATCGPEIERKCSIGVSVTAGLGRPGIVLLWSLGLAAFGLAWLTQRRLRSATADGAPKPARRRLSPLRAAVAVLAAVIAAVVVVALPASPRSTQPEPPAGPSDRIDVRVVSAILHPSNSTAGRRRHAARVSVHVRIDNRGPRRLRLPAPRLLSGGEALAYDARQYRLGALEPGGTVDAILRFEPRSAFTQRLVTEGDAQLWIAGRSLPLALKIGGAVRKSRFRGALSRPKVDRAEARRRPAVRPTTAPAARRPRPPAPRRPSTAPEPRRTPPRATRPPAPPPPPATPPRPQRPPPDDNDPGELFDDSG